MLGSLNFTYIVVVIVCLLISITIHEFMHAYVGYKLGDDTAFEGGRVSFNPLRHIDPYMTIVLPVITLVLFHTPILVAKPVPFNPSRVKYGEYGAALLAAAGPFSNLALAFIAALFLRIVNLGEFMNAVIGLFEEINVALFVFNLIPIPPLDGSRVLYAFAPEPLQRIMEQLESVGLFIIFALILMGGFGGTLMGMIQFVMNILP